VLASMSPLHYYNVSFYTGMWQYAIDTGI